ncbi:MAG: response regulator [Phycisphaerales bacterium JB059]
MAERAPTVLLVDNDDSMLAALAARLGDSGYRCLTASSGAQAMAIFGETPVDLIVTDLNMPSGDGVSLARAVRQFSEAPIVIVTGFRDEYRRELRAIANVSILEKPFRTDQLLEVLEAELTLHDLEVE